MLSNFLIGLREGLEAALVVGILVAYLVKTGHRDRLPLVGVGVGAAIALSLGVGALLTFTSSSLDHRQQELFGGVTSVVAVAFVTVMVFWMRRAARHLGGELGGRLESALKIGSAAVVLTAFLAVAREGLETALFLWAAVGSAGSGTVPLLGATAGLAVAAGIGWQLYRQAVRIDLRRFFTWTGAALVVVAAGVLAYGVHDLQEAGVLPATTLAYDVSAQVPPGSWYGSLLKGTLSFSSRASWLEVGVWLAYLVPVAALFLLGSRRPAGRRPAQSPAVEGAAV